ncbi:hypothetical protein SAMN05216203_1833 [Marinobacter daqiaonensis]|uniref:Probable inorganic carbon transporter subunit DabA n=1 Tax=Marinobacter daqiaonensis TaxID=650891 RepID=A0A1I6I557_9GAMM|nr:DUF2309 domain-containing protein [Marinobacter daqiaonensis]SFR61852.1 hypothetical protein SAMN05216203_1833 [Marinobacter daqiaonensis]
MNMPLSPRNFKLPPETAARLAEATGRIAPAWPLDRMIAVNPLWEMRDRPYQEVSARWGALAGIRCLLPRQQYRRLYREGQITDTALVQAAKRQGQSADLEQLHSGLRDTGNEPAHWHNIADLLDADRDPTRMYWTDEIIHQISQFCAMHYQQRQRMAGDESLESLYSHWLNVVQKDYGISIVMKEPGLRSVFAGLPADPEELIAAAIDELGIDESVLDAYAEALLLDINGWASYVAYRRWQANLAGEPDSDMLQLLAIRLAWELVIWRHLKENDRSQFEQLASRWRQEQDSLDQKLDAHLDDQRLLWVWAQALELSDQHHLQGSLLASTPTETKVPDLQAIFCIDVRSEVMRRALESQHQGIETYGFAGFFGLPLEYAPAGTSLVRPQLPGLLKAQITAREASPPGHRPGALNRQSRWRDWSQSASSAFSMVESVGLWYAFKLFKQSLFPSQQNHPVNTLSHHREWELSRDGEPLGVEERAALAKGILHAMGLGTFAPKILLVGHGSQCSNNLHAAGLDCGACGGQTGEINVRVLAQLLNDPEIRRQLDRDGLPIPDGTVFVAALHNTTTDEVTCLDNETDSQLQDWLHSATRQAQKERAGRLDPELEGLEEHSLHAALGRRARDASQVRPEWGLADNAAFIVAPRNWTRELDLGGRSFLHDYDWQRDSGFSILELVMTAPMVVTHWINMQYNASVTDNLKFGSGNKVLHNAVNGNMGVFEGNGGDLRIGLPLQSLHNGERWMHTPRRLSVYIAAPREAITDIVARHDTVRHLIDNDWIYLFRWDQQEGIERLYRQQWREMAESPQFSPSDVRGAA